MRWGRYSAIISSFGNRSDRFLGSYGDQLTVPELLAAAARVEGLSGVELIAMRHVTPKNVEAVRAQLEAHGLRAVSVNPNLFGTKAYSKGAFTSRDPQVRACAVADTQAVMDIAAELHCNLVNVWNGQDGYDYPFQADYLEERGWLAEGLRACGQHRTDVRLSLEYKPKEPRTHSYLGTAAGTLLVVQEVGLPNVGVTIDVGHALVAYEDVAESIAVVARHGKLFHMHLNDNYRLWDDDMLVGSVHTIEYLELLYWLDRVGYEGYLSLDQYPYREDPVKAIAESVRWLEVFRQILDRAGAERIGAMLQRGDATEASRLLREAMFPG